MDLLASVKKAPRWAWYTAGGIAVGAGALKLYKNRTTSTSDPNADPNATTPVATTMGTDNTVGGGSPVGVIVPPVILPSATQTDPTGTGALAAITDSATGLIGTLAGVFSPYVSDQQSTIHDLAIGSQNLADDFGLAIIAGAGSPPTPQQQTPSPVQTPPAVAPATTPSTPTTKPKCSGLYPTQNSKGECYRKEYSDGKKKMSDGKVRSKGCWDLYATRADVKLSGGQC